MNATPHLLALGLGLACTSAAFAADPALSTCVPITVSAAHAVPRTGENPFLATRRLAPIEDGTVPCLQRDSLQADRCSFHTGTADDESGHWVEDPQGRRYALVGQSVAKDGDRAGAYVVAAPLDHGTVACIEGARRRDAAGTSASDDLATPCVVEVMGSASNALRRPLRNYATIPVCTSSYPHPDGARMVNADRAAGVYCYAGEGAGLNDRNGQERDRNGAYLVGYGTCHVGWSGGYEVFVAKRPATVKARVDVKSPLVWRPVASARIAN
jgi:hypothetical protein